MVPLRQHGLERVGVTGSRDTVRLFAPDHDTDELDRHDLHERIHHAQKTTGERIIRLMNVHELMEFARAISLEELRENKWKVITNDEQTKHYLRTQLIPIWNQARNVMQKIAPKATSGNTDDLRSRIARLEPGEKLKIKLARPEDYARMTPEALTKYKRDLQEMFRQHEEKLQLAFPDGLSHNHFPMLFNRIAERKPDATGFTQERHLELLRQDKVFIQTILDGSFAIHLDGEHNLRLALHAKHSFVEMEALKKRVTAHAHHLRERYGITGVQVHVQDAEGETKSFLLRLPVPQVK